MEYIQPFLNTETPFMLLFVALFFYVIKSNKDREQKMAHIIDNDLKRMSEDLHVLMGVWKILLENEVQKEGSDKK
jgi:BhlA holin family